MKPTRRARPGRAVAALTGLAVALAGLGACAPTDRPSAGRVTIAAGARPLAEAARWVGGDRVDVVDLTPPGAEPHDLEVTTVQMDRILDADLAVVVGGGFQAAVEDATRGRTGPTLVVLDAPGVSGTDPHVWLDPIAFRAVVDALAARLGRLDPAHADGYRRRAAAADARLGALDARIRTALATCRRRTVLTSHDAFARFGRRYDLRVESIAGLDPEQEPDPRRLAALADLARRTGATTVFTEELVSPQVAAVLAREVGVRTAVLSPIESRPTGAGPQGYIARMDRNRVVLTRGLGCVSR
jgi:zinc transport system substrate-binding protein